MSARLMVSAPRKSSGKTTLSIGLAAALAARGLDVRCFKKGPDFIDPVWLARAAGRGCRNLDFFIMGTEAIRESFWRNARGGDVALIEGNHGLFDGQDLEGGDCSAALAELLECPVLLVVDCKGSSRGIAALVNGHLSFPGGGWIRGVILNNVASPRHEERLKAALARYCPVPVLGSVPRSGLLEISERHLGLQPVDEGEDSETRIGGIREFVTRYVDLDGVLELARSASAPPAPEPAAPRTPGVVGVAGSARIRVAMAVDQSTHFYYPENRERLGELGVELVPFSLLRDRALPDVDGLYLGGGFPEMFMEELAANREMMARIREVADAGMPIYAECGGLMVLGERLRWGGRDVELAGALPIDLAMERRPVGYGYMQIEGTPELPWPGEGRLIPCHEFHHSRITRLGEGLRFAFRVRRGYGVDGRRDGILYRNILACYAHPHTLGAPGWGEFLVGFWGAKKRK